MKNRIIKIIVFISFFLLFISFINNYLSIKLWDYDFWWHISTGRYIVENKTVPDKDPFSDVNNLEENKNAHPAREQFILKQYWLAQVIFFKIYDAFGDKGIIVFRSIILFSIVLLVYWWLKSQKVGFYIIFALVFFVFSNTISFTGERPVLFTLLFTVLTFFILDDFKNHRGKLIFILIPLMLLWANLHGGVLLGNVMIITYMVGESVNFLFKRTEFSKRQLGTLCIVGIIAIAASTVSPAGVKMFLQFIPQNRIFEQGIHEYFSPFYLSKEGLRPLDLEYIALIILFFVLTILRNKKIDTVYYFLLSGLLYMSISSLRYEVYYVSISVLILGRELHYTINEYLNKFEISKKKIEYGAALLIFISSILFAVGFLSFEKIPFEKSIRGTVPQGAADFILLNNVKGNIFSDMGSGGYLIWRLYPWKKVFIDTRSLNYTVKQEHGWILTSRVSLQNKELPKGKKPLWERLLDHYNISIIVLNTMDSTGTTPPLLFSLIKSEKWIPVFYDLISVVVVRDNEENNDIINKFKQREEDIYNALIARLTQMAIYNRGNPEFMLSLGDAFYNMERYDDALKAYVYADNRHPDKEFIKWKINMTKKQLEHVRDELRKEDL